MNLNKMTDSMELWKPMMSSTNYYCPYHGIAFLLLLRLSQQLLSLVSSIHYAIHFAIGFVLSSFHCIDWSTLGSHGRVELAVCQVLVSCLSEKKRKFNLKEKKCDSSNFKLTSWDRIEVQFFCCFRRNLMISISFMIRSKGHSGSSTKYFLWSIFN